MKTLQEYIESIKYLERDWNVKSSEEEIISLYPFYVKIHSHR